MKSILFNDASSKPHVITQVVDYITALGFSITAQDVNKPWGAYFVIDEKDINRFIKEFFAEVEVRKSGKLTPKILLVAPTEILSWQYHYRRAELWKVVAGPVDIMQSETDTETTRIRKTTGELIAHDALVRHRLIGAGVWGVVAEIWQHTNSSNPSNEEDIVRVSDVYGR